LNSVVEQANTAFLFVWATMRGGTAKPRRAVAVHGFPGYLSETLRLLVIFLSRFAR
jgi:hypothetical protein